MSFQEALRLLVATTDDVPYVGPEIREAVRVVKAYLDGKKVYYGEKDG